MTYEPTTTTLAQARVVSDVLAWGAVRLQPPDGLAARLLARMTHAIGDWIAVRERRGEERARPLLVSKTRLSRLVCDGLQRDPIPYVHAWANVRGTLVHAAIEADVDGLRSMPAEEVVTVAWHRLATLRPGDPSSVGAWLNARDEGERRALLGESSELLAGFREVWPDRAALGLTVKAIVGILSSRGRAICEGTVRRKAFEMGL
jgi:hypothetical protein